VELTGVTSSSSSRRFLLVLNWKVWELDFGTEDDVVFEDHCDGFVGVGVDGVCKDCC